MKKQLSFLATTEKKDLCPLKVYFDGAARGNPGEAGAGVYILQNDAPIVQKGFYLNKKTNNQAEYLALTLAILLAQQICKKKQILKPLFCFYSDSELLVKQMKGEYRVKNLILAQLKKIIDSLLKNSTFTFTHVLRAKNKSADELANLGVDKKQKIPTDFLKILSQYDLLI